MRKTDLRLLRAMAITEIIVFTMAQFEAGTGNYGVSVRNHYKGIFGDFFGKTVGRTLNDLAHSGLLLSGAVLAIVFLIIFRKGVK